MRLARVILLCIACVTIVSLNGCVQTSQGEVTSIAFDTAIPTISRTPTFLFTPTLSIKPAITDPPSPVPTKTQTPIPTLEMEIAEEFLQELLISDGDCNLPCLWGIVPGKSTHLDAIALLEPLRGISEYPTMSELSSESGSMDFNSVQGDFRFDTHIAYLTESGVVSNIGFRVSMFKREIDQSNGEYWVGVYDSDLFRQRFQAYTVSRVLSKLGVPEAVVISTDGGPARGRNVPGFYVLLLYPDQGVLVRYTTFRQLIGGTVHGCLANAHAEFELFPAGQPGSFSHNIAATEWADWWPVPDDSPYVKPLEKATSMSLQQFYETFRQPTNKCLETPANIWYLPG